MFACLQPSCDSEGLVVSIFSFIWTQMFTNHFHQMGAGYQYSFVVSWSFFWYWDHFPISKMSLQQFHIFHSINKMIYSEEKWWIKTCWVGMKVADGKLSFFFFLIETTGLGRYFTIVSQNYDHDCRDIMSTFLSYHQWNTRKASSIKGHAKKML